MTPDLTKHEDYSRLGPDLLPPPSVRGHSKDVEVCEAGAATGVHDDVQPPGKCCHEYQIKYDSNTFHHNHKTSYCYQLVWCLWRQKAFELYLAECIWFLKMCQILNTNIS